MYVLLIIIENFYKILNTLNLLLINVLYLNMTVYVLLILLKLFIFLNDVNLHVLCYINQGICRPTGILSHIAILKNGNIVPNKNCPKKSFY